VTLLKDARTRLRELQFRTPGSGEARTVRLPFGCGVNAKHFRFEYHPNSGGFEVRAIQQTRRRAEHHTIIYPGYQATDSVISPVTGETVSLKLWTVYTDKDRMAARQVIQRVHYLTDNGRGLYLACAFTDPRQQSEILAKAKKTINNLDDIPWFLPPGDIIGCGVIDTLWHGNPIAGRSLIAKELNIKGERWKQWPRDQVIRNMRIAWASRFAIDRPYQRMGIGTIIARHLKRVARRYHAPSPDFLEVITTSARPTPGSISNGDFLVDAGYAPLGFTMKSSRMMVMDWASGYRNAVPAIKNYYFADLRHD
jgi:GNAT superfamily N-acetyltransferase